MVDLELEKVKVNDKKSKNVDENINKIFLAVDQAINNVGDAKKDNLTIEKVDATINALFDAVNNANQGKKTVVPDFAKFLKD